VSGGRVTATPQEIAGDIQNARDETDRLTRPDRKVTRERLEEVVRVAAADIEALNQDLGFRVHDGSGQLMVEIVQRETGEVIRTQPPEEFLDLAVRIREMVGLFIDETT
jgi:flagellar protein FlaG